MLEKEIDELGQELERLSILYLRCTGQGCRREG